MKIYKKIQQVTVTSAILFLAGCSYFNPTYDKPETPLPKQWQKPKKEGLDLTKFAWWKQLNDPTLNKLVDDALLHNNQIQIAMANVLAAQADLDKAKYAWVPSLGLSGNGVAGQAFATDFSNKSGHPALDHISRDKTHRYQAYIARLSVNYNLNIMQLYHAGKIADLNLSVQKQIKKAADLSIINQVTVAYFSLLAAKQQVKIQQQIEQVQKQLVMANKKAFMLGALSEVEIGQSEEALYDSQSRLETMRYDIGKYENVLKLLSNQNPGKVKTGLDIMALKPENIPAGLSSTILQNRPDIVMSEFQLQQANASIGLARSQFFPTIDLTSFVGGASLALSNLFTINTGLWSTAGAIKLPILDLGIFADTEKAQAQYKAAYYNYIDTVKSSFAQVDDALNYYSFINKSLKAQNHALEVAKKQYQFIEKEYKLGKFNKNKTLVQKVKLDQVRLGQLQVKSSQLVGLSLAYEALAAGYDNLPEQTDDKQVKKAENKKLNEEDEHNKRIDDLIKQMKSL